MRFLKQRAAKLRENKTVSADIEAVQSDQHSLPLPEGRVDLAL